MGESTGPSRTHVIKLELVNDSDADAFSLPACLYACFSSDQLHVFVLSLRRGSSLVQAEGAVKSPDSQATVTNVVPEAGMT